MDTALPLSALANKIIQLVTEKNNGSEFQAINKNMLPGVSLEDFFAVLKELKSSGRTSFYKEYEYKPYTGFGDITPKQYNTMDILLKINS